MKRFLFGLILIASLASCSSGSKLYVYTVEMTHPVVSKELYYENDTFSIAYELHPQWLKFDIYNKSSEGLKINWDEVSFSVNGKTHRVVHKETGVYKVTDVQPPTTIPPKSKLNDVLIPTSKIVARQGAISFGSLSVNDLFPIKDFGNKKTRSLILSYKGQRITVFFPYYIRGQYVSQYYDLMIRDVAPKSKKKEPAPKKTKKKK